MSVLDRYVVRAILSSVLLVMLVVLVLGALFVFIDQQDDIGTGHYTALGAFWYTLLNMPQLAYELLPITALIGSLLGLGSLARSEEHTSELQSQSNIVCRLLLEKKKKITTSIIYSCSDVITTLLCLR